MTVMKIFIVVIIAALKTLTILGDFHFTLLHNGDIFARLREISALNGVCLAHEKCYGGFARMKRAVEDIRKREKGKRTVIFLNAGDNFQGTAFYTIFKWKVMVPFMNILGLDAMSLGNHEFDDGPSGLAPYLKNVKTVSLAANIDVSEEPSLISPMLKKHLILNANGTKIGIVGYLLPESKDLADTGRVKFYDEIESIGKEIDELKLQGISIFIALGHSGFAKDMEIAEKIPDVDIVVGGHSNTFLYSGVPPDREVPVGSYPKIVTQKSKKKVPVVQAYAFTKYLGYLELSFDLNGEILSYFGNPILLDHTHKEDESTLAELKIWGDKLGKFVKEIIGKTTVIWDAGEKICRLQECNIGDLVTDALVAANIDKYAGKGWTDAPIAIVNGGGIRASIDASDRGGKITYEDVIRVMPFDNSIYKVKIKGRYLREALEFSVRHYDITLTKGVSEFLQVSGIRVTYDISKDPGNRVTNVQVLCSKCKKPEYSDLRDGDEYSLILAKFLKRGGDKYSVIKKNIYDVEFLNITDTQALRNYIHKKEELEPITLDRITIDNIPSSREDTSKGTRIAVSLITPILIIMSYISRKINFI